MDRKIHKRERHTINMMLGIICWPSWGLEKAATTAALKPGNKAAPANLKLMIDWLMIDWLMIDAVLWALWCDSQWSLPDFLICSHFRSVRPSTALDKWYPAVGGSGPATAAVGAKLFCCRIVRL